MHRSCASPFGTFGWLSELDLFLAPEWMRTWWHGHFIRHTYICTHSPFSTITGRRITVSSHFFNPDRTPADLGGGSLSALQQHRHRWIRHSSVALYALTVHFYCSLTLSCKSLDTGGQISFKKFTFYKLNIFLGPHFMLELNNNCALNSVGNVLLYSSCLPLPVPPVMAKYFLFSFCLIDGDTVLCI